MAVESEKCTTNTGGRRSEKNTRIFKNQMHSFSFPLTSESVDHVDTENVVHDENVRSVDAFISQWILTGKHSIFIHVITF